MSYSVIAKKKLTYLLLDRDGKLLHLAYPEEKKYAIGTEFSEENKYEETHAFIARNCLAGDEKSPCQMIIAYPKSASGDSNHGFIALTSALCLKNIEKFQNKKVIFTDKKETYPYSGECHGLVSFDEILKIAENESLLDGIKFMLKGTQTTSLYRIHSLLSSHLVQHKKPFSLTEDYKDKPNLITNIPLSALTLDRKHYDTGLKIVSSGGGGIDESSITPSKNKHYLEARKNKFRFIKGCSLFKNSSPSVLDCNNSTPTRFFNSY